MRTLLVVEDNAEICKQLKWGLVKEYTLLFAESRKVAVKLVEKHKPSVVTLDLGLPPDEEGVTEGFGCLEEVLLLSPRTKVIVITGRDERQNALQALLSGAYDYYPKPIDLGVLKVVLERAFYLPAGEELSLFVGSAVWIRFEALGKESGRLIEDVHRVLKKLSGQNFEAEYPLWRTWYDENKEKIEGTGDIAGPKKKSGWKKNEGAGFYGVKTYSKKRVRTVKAAAKKKVAVRKVTASRAALRKAAAKRQAIAKRAAVARRVAAAKK